MKQIIYGCLVGSMLIVTLFIVININGKGTRQVEIDNALSASVEHAVETTMHEKSYSINNNQEFIADFTQNLLLQISNDSDIEVKVAKADYEKGLLCVRVEETFMHPNGKEGKNYCETTVVFENVPTNVAFVKLTYQVQESEYKTYEIKKGDKEILPQDPVVDGKIFVGWKDKETKEMAIANAKAEKDRTYEAVFR